MSYTMSKQISGGISGAITDPFSKEATSFANIMYEEIRKQTTDCQRISENTGIDLVLIKKIKQYLFYDQHEIKDLILIFLLLSLGGVYPQDIKQKFFRMIFYSLNMN